MTGQESISVHAWQAGFTRLSLHSDLLAHPKPSHAAKKWTGYGDQIKITSECRSRPMRASATETPWKKLIFPDISVTCQN